MAHTLLPDSYQVKSSADMGTGLSVALGLSVWFALVFTLGASEVFVAPYGTPPLALLIAVTAPLILFMAGMRLSTWMRERVVAADLRIHNGDASMENRRFQFSGLIHLRDTARLLRLARGTRRHRGRCYRSVDPRRAHPPARFRREQQFCCLECFWDLGPCDCRRTGSVRIAVSHRRSYRLGSDGGDDTSPTTARPGFLCAVVAHLASDRADSGAPFRRGKKDLKRLSERP